MAGPGRCGDCAACALYFDSRTVNIWSGKVLKTSSDPGDLAEKQEIKSLMKRERQQHSKAAAVIKIVKRDKRKKEKSTAGDDL